MVNSNDINFTGVWSPTLDQGIVRHNCYKASVDANGTTFTLRPSAIASTDSYHVTGVIIHSTGAAYFGRTSDTVAQGDTTGGYGGYIPANAWSNFNWADDTLVIKAAPATTVNVTINVITTEVLVS